MEVCNASSAGQENLLVTPFISPNLPESREINVFVEYNCPADSIGNCNTNFSLHIYESPMEDSTAAEEFSNYGEIEDMVLNNTQISRSLTAGMGFYLAFRDTSSCVEISRVRVVDTVCDGVVNQLVQYPPIASGGASVNGMCVDGAVEVSGSLTARCPFRGSYDFTSGSCQCMAGQERSGDECNGNSVS